MKAIKSKLLLLALLSVFSLQPSTLFAQGTLTPPGAPAPTMKSLDQIEPRTPIASVPFTITNPGSYYLTTNLTTDTSGILSGILIEASDVTLDLNGFALMTTNDSGIGIAFVSSITNITVRNGSIDGWSAGVRPFEPFAPVSNLVLERLNVSDCTQGGISFSCPVTARNCACYGNGGVGIAVAGGQVINCDAGGNGGDGIDATNCAVRDCSAANNGGRGIVISSGVVSGCLVQSNALSGIYVSGPGSRVVNNTCSENNTTVSLNEAGITVSASFNLLEGNQINANDIVLSGTNNIVVKNFVFTVESRNPGYDYQVLTANNVLGPVVLEQFGTITNSNPWANFAY